MTDRRMIFASGMARGVSAALGAIAAPVGITLDSVSRAILGGLVGGFALGAPIG